MTSFANSVRSELRKFFTTRLWWGMGIAFFLVAAGFAVLFGFLFTMDGGAGQGAPVGTKTQVANTVYSAGIGVGYLLMLAIGIMAIGAEYRHKTISSTFLSTPKRVHAMGAKVVALLMIATGYGILAQATSFAVGGLVLRYRGWDPVPDSTIFRSLALGLLVLGLWALIGLGLGILISNQIAALMIGVGVAWIAEPLLGLALRLTEFGEKYVVPYLPSQATGAVLNTAQDPGTTHVLSWWVGALTLLGWALITAGPGVLRVNRQDIS